VKKKNIFPRLSDKTAWTGEQVPLKDPENAKTMNSRNFVAVALYTSFDFICLHVNEFDMEK